MQYEYSVHYNEVQHAWLVTWTGFDQDRPHQMKGDVVICNPFDEAIASLRSFAARFDSDRVDAVA